MPKPAVPGSGTTGASLASLTGVYGKLQQAAPGCRSINQTRAHGTIRQEACSAIQNCSVDNDGASLSWGGMRMAGAHRAWKPTGAGCSAPWISCDRIWPWAPDPELGQPGL